MNNARNSPLRAELDLFESKRAELVEEHRGEYVLIKGDEIVAFFKTEEEGLDAAYQRFANSPFLLRKIADSDTPVLFTSLYLARADA